LFHKLVSSALEAIIAVAVLRLFLAHDQLVLLILHLNVLALVSLFGRLGDLVDLLLVGTMSCQSIGIGGVLRPADLHGCAGQGLLDGHAGWWLLGPLGQGSARGGAGGG